MVQSTACENLIENISFFFNLPIQSTNKTAIYIHCLHPAGDLINSKLCC